MSEAATEPATNGKPMPAVIISGINIPPYLGSDKSHVTLFEVLTPLMHGEPAYCICKSSTV